MDDKEHHWFQINSLYLLLQFVAGFIFMQFCIKYRCNTYCWIMDWCTFSNECVLWMYSLNTGPKNLDIYVEVINK